MGKSKKFLLKFTDHSNFKGNRKSDSNYYRRIIASKKITYLHSLMENIEQLAIVSSFVFPEIKTGLIDRFLILSQHFRKKSFIILTKGDLVDRGTQEFYKTFYQKFYKIYVFSTVTVKERDEILEKIRSRFKGRQTAIVGHSGVGKTSLLNRVDPNYHGMVKQISHFTKRGRHTTTRIRKYDFPENFGEGSVFDMPGLKEIDFIDLNGRQLRQYYPEFLEHHINCSYRDCSHTHEPVCGIREAVEKEVIHPIRYRNYLNILESLPDT